MAAKRRRRIAAASTTGIDAMLDELLASIYQTRRLLTRLRERVDANGESSAPVDDALASTRRSEELLVDLHALLESRTTRDKRRR